MKTEDINHLQHTLWSYLHSTESSCSFEGIFNLSPLLKDRVVRRVDKVNRRISHHPADSVVCFGDT